MFELRFMILHPLLYSIRHQKRCSCVIFLGSLCDDDDDDDNTANGKGAARDSRKGPNDPQFAANSLPSPSAAFDSNIAGQTDGDRRTRHQALLRG